MVELDAYTTLRNDANLVAYWRMEGNSTDSKGSNNGTDTSISYSTPNGKFGQGAGFNGTTSKIVLGATTLTHTSFTIMGWINAAATPAGVMYAQGNSGDNNPIIEINFLATQVELVNRDNSTVGLVSTPSLTLTTGLWYFIAWTCTTTASHFYVNASDIDSQTFTANTGTFNTYNIGTRQRVSNDSFFNGAIDDVSIFSRVLTPTEITNYYNATSPLFIRNASSRQAVKRAAYY